jgi:hypothetical protein
MGHKISFCAIIGAGGRVARDKGQTRQRSGLSPVLSGGYRCFIKHQLFNLKFTKKANLWG